jgi:hypothetical protein
MKPGVANSRECSESDKCTEQDLERALYFLLQQWRLGQRVERFYQMFTPGEKAYKGGVAAVQCLLRESRPGVFDFLKAKGKLGLSVESLVLRPAWEHLFSNADKAIARLKMLDLGDGPVPDEISCQEKARLIEEYTHAASELSNALSALRSRNVSGNAERGRLQRIADEGEIKLEQIGEAFEKHTSEHGC